MRFITILALFVGSVAITCVSWHFGYEAGYKAAVDFQNQPPEIIVIPPSVGPPKNIHNPHPPRQP